MHGDVVYMTTPQDSPETKFRTGVSFLQGRMPKQARQLIREAMTDYTTNEVCFYWLLAMVSGRTRHELNKDETVQLRDRSAILRLSGEDAWRDGVRIIDRLLESAGKAEADIRVVVKELDALREPQRGLILEHLELYLDGPIEDHLWHRALSKAKTDQMASDREDRIWKFFHPVPAVPLPREPRPSGIPLGTWVQTVTTTAVLLVTTAHLGYLVLRSGSVPSMLAYLLAVTGAFVGVRNAVDWRFRVVRCHAKNREYLGFATGTPPGGFAKRAKHRIDHYFAIYLPSGVDRDAWLAQTKGIRGSLCEEIAEVYAGIPGGVEKVAWLIRHRASDVSTRHRKGTLWNYREELATPRRTKTLAILGLATLTGGGGLATSGAALIDPLRTIGMMLVLLIAGWIGVRTGLHIVLERRRYAADRIENLRTWEADKMALARWRAKLANKPSDKEMAAWLDCDRKVLLEEALRHYRLTMSGVIAYAFIEAPAPSSARARVRNGPWRYKRYKLLVFLITQEGVRQLNVTLDSLNGTFHNRQRLNYRFEAVASVRVSEADNGDRTFQLTLVNSDEITVPVSQGMEELQLGENPGEVAEVTLDAAGLAHTLHVLEGIAAEGKGWVEQQDKRTGNLLGTLNDSGPPQSS
ncbi:hypothetical protein [Streptosporangium sp. LJ11]|uniref:hypothetical protein n=1 Tax=Streptosporangium sp. LJ11 TaxID=3436927 RepID=UPI003F79A958